MTEPDRAADGPNESQNPAAKAEPKTFRPAVKIAAALLVLAVFAVFAKLFFWLAPDFGWTTPSNVADLASPLIYSKEELRRDLPHFTERQGGKCIEIRSGLNWDPRFGFASKKLDKDCVRKLFTAHEKAVVLMGGSAMENNQAPNYLTTIDSYAFGNDTSFASLNLAESGARHSNMLIRFLHEVVELHPTYVVFLDGFNEFNSVRLGGDPEDDFYWTAGVKDRVQRPFIYYRDKLLEKSRLLQALAVKTGFINSARVPRDFIDPKGVVQAAEYYVKMRAYTETMCEAYRIKCIFVVQPVALLDNAPNEAAKKATVDHLKSFISDVGVYKGGYEYIFSKAGTKVLDATRLFEGQDDIYIDVVHFNKRGSKLIGEFIHSALK